MDSPTLIKTKQVLNGIHALSDDYDDEDKVDEESSYSNHGQL
jgi:hypothetical protein